MIRIDKAIRDFIGGEEYLISGTQSWYNADINLGQTCIHVVKWVYNENIEGIYNLKDIPGKFKFIKEKYPKQVTKEYWLIDMLNNINSLDISNTEAIIYLANYLRSEYFNIDELNNLCKIYAKQHTKDIIEKSKTTDEKYFLENEELKVINLTWQDIYVYNREGTKVIRKFPKNGIEILIEENEYGYDINNDIIPVVVKNFQQPKELPIGYDVYIVYITVAEALRNTKGIVFADRTSNSIINNYNIDFLSVRSFGSFYRD